MGRCNTPVPDDYDAMEPEELQRAIQDLIVDLDRRSSVTVTMRELKTLEAMILAKLDNGSTLTLREQDILDHVEDVRTDFFGTRHPQRNIIPLGILLLVAIIAALWFWLF